MIKYVKRLPSWVLKLLYFSRKFVIAVFVFLHLLSLSLCKNFTGTWVRIRYCRKFAISVFDIFEICCICKTYWNIHVVLQTISTHLPLSPNISFISIRFWVRLTDKSLLVRSPVKKFILLSYSLPTAFTEEQRSLLPVSWEKCL